MGKIITLKYPGKCTDCGADLPVGSTARWYGRGHVYGLECHEQKPRGNRQHSSRESNDHNELMIALESSRTEELLEDPSKPDYRELESNGLPTLKVYLVENLAPNDVYAEFSCPNDEELALVVNMNHPFITNIIGRDPIKLKLFCRMLFVDALVERSIRRRGQNAPAKAFRAVKDRFLRATSSSQSSTETAESESDQ